MKTISDNYRELNRELHDRLATTGEQFGAHGYVFADPIFEVLTKNSVKSVLAGC